MKRNLKGIIALAAFVIFALLSILTGYKAKLDENGKPIIGAESENQESYLDIHWEEMMAEAAKNAVDVQQLFREANGDLKSVADKYSTGSGQNITVTGSATVRDANTKSKAGYLVLDIGEDTGKYELQLQIGAIFKGSAFRDSLTCIQFSDFDNQMEWSNINSQITGRIYETILSGYNMADLIGKTVQFSGTFTVGSDAKLKITPFAFSVE